MDLNKKYHFSRLWVFIGGFLLLGLQSIWLFHAYRQEHIRLMAELEDAFAQAYQKEQTYRVPVVDIVNPGEVSIQSCGNEEIMIVRKCSPADTIVYNNVSGRSIEKFIDRVFRDLRENIAPMNIYCLSDLFAGMLHDKDVPVAFVIERYNIATAGILETTLPPGEERLQRSYDNIITIEISDTEAVRTILQVTLCIIFENMVGVLVCTSLLVVCIFLCSMFICREVKQGERFVSSDSERDQSNFCIGKYNFDPLKNELQGFGGTVQLNKKENSILSALCAQQGNIVDRNTLLQDNWGSSGIIYSRSLDTYLTTLRKYLKKDPDIQIVTVKGVGYKLVYKGS